MSKPLEVTLTVGTSFSIGGAFNDPDQYKPVGEKSLLCGGDGLPFMLDCLERYNLKASFFIESAQHAYFGDEPMGRIAKMVMDAGHDTQLQVHPCWYHFDKSTDYSKNDSCADRPYDELKAIFEKSIAAFERICHKRPDVLRCGNMQVDKQVYGLLHDLEIPMSSSIGLGMGIPEGKELLLYNGRSKIDGVMEVPLFTYQDKDIMGRYPTKTLQMTSCSWREMRYILKKAREMDLEQIVILSQPFDYIKKKDVQYEMITKNRTNQERLEKLCSFISEHDQDFTMATFGDNAERWASTEVENVKRFKIPTSYRNARKIENIINNCFWNY